jgi:hypothetical protein
MLCPGALPRNAGAAAGQRTPAISRAIGTDADACHGGVAPNNFSNGLKMFRML